MFQRNGNNRLENLGDLRVFAELARLGSLSAAARVLGITPAGASKRLRRLEEVLGARLVNRTTRKVGLTEDGRAFLGHCVNALAELDAADDALGNHQGPLRGRLRVTAPASFGRKHVAPALPDFMKRHPNLSISLHLSDGVTDLVEEGFDLGLRIGNLADSTLIARQIGEDHRILVAAPDYLDGIGPISSPTDLARCNALLLAHPLPQDQWTFEGPGGLRQTVKVSGTLESNNCEALREALLAGLGVALRPTWDLGDDVRSGRLVRVLPAWRIPPLPVHAVYPGTRTLSPKVRAFIDHVATAFGRRGYWNEGIIAV